MAIVTLHPGKERPVVQHHPWVFSGAIARIQGPFPERGDVVDVQSASGEWLARGCWSDGSQIRVRLFTWNPHEPVDDALIRRRIERAIDGRRRLGMLTEDGACRLVYAESDGIPGLIVDYYAGFLAVQLLTQAMALRSVAITRMLTEMLAPRGIYERSDADVRDKEGLPPASGILWGETPPARVRVRLPGDLWHVVDLCTGQKTGAYLDQAFNRLRVAAHCAGADILDCFCYTGGFTIAAIRAGACSAIAVDASEAALNLLRDGLALNNVNVPVETVAADVFQLLRRYRDEQRRFDVIVLDPPKFAHTQAQVERATRGYKDINLLAMQLLRPGGILATFSCSGLVSSDLFQKVVFGAALDARRDVQIIERLAQSPDHPVLLTFPEGEYLKGLICRVW
ncbi:MAG: class I SAM-dependent methyltransferase [Roseiflexaceae bacterium]|nr:class I SAM-dependent methyltransferase [Roseiflexus sp.]MDW8211986.1 class I SAM-dependent methyltransferase [Roseiflexaceae bacterium]